MASFHLSIKSGKKGTAKEHANYIARLGSHNKRGDLIAAGHGNLPTWANNNPEAFWQASDEHERKNGAAYRELEIALPDELQLEENHELVLQFAKEMLGSKPFQYAIHGPDAALNGDTKNTHVHLMFSDRADDGVERTAEQTFRRFNPKNPEAGGRRKDSGGKNRMMLRDEVVETRRLCAELQNAALAAAGHDARVDHRTLQEQGIDREPERHLGPAKVRNLTPEKKEAFLAKRSKKIAHPTIEN